MGFPGLCPPVSRRLKSTVAQSYTLRFVGVSVRSSVGGRGSILPGTSVYRLTFDFRKMQVITFLD
jgi:hypothetical protein